MKSGFWIIFFKTYDLFLGPGYDKYNYIIYFI